MTLLSVEDLQASYGETKVLSGVSLSVDEGEVAALVGRNGVGKTTTLRSIMGAIAPTGGRITFDGEEITDLGQVETARRGIGFVPEDRRIFPGLTVEENLRLAGYGGGESAEGRSLEWVYDTFEALADRREGLGSQLSGGEQQMLSIARALVGGADLLLLDEPTEGLAPMIVDQVGDVIREINDEGVTILLVEQNVAAALDLADRVFVLDRGRIVYEGTSDQLREDEETVDRHLGVSL